MAFAMYYTVFEQNGISLEKLSEMLAATPPAKRLGLKAGLIKERYPADLVLVDLNWEGKINPKEFVSKSKNTIPLAARPVLKSNDDHGEGRN